MPDIRYTLEDLGRLPTPPPIDREYTRGPISVSCMMFHLLQTLTNRNYAYSRDMILRTDRNLIGYIVDEAYSLGNTISSLTDANVAEAIMTAKTEVYTMQQRFGDLQNAVRYTTVGGEDGATEVEEAAYRDQLVVASDSVSKLLMAYDEQFPTTHMLRGGEWLATRF